MTDEQPMYDPNVFRQNKEEKDVAIPIFGPHPVRDDQKSKEAGHDVYVNVDYVEILTPGSKDRPHRRVTEEDKRRWPRQWEAYVNSRQLPEDGLPLEQWPVAGPAECKTLNSFHVRTVEQLAAVPDGNLKNIGPGYFTLKQKAIKYLEAAEEGTMVESLQQKVRDLEATIMDRDMEIDELKQKLADQSAD